MFKNTRGSFSNTISFESKVQKMWQVHFEKNVIYLMYLFHYVFWKQIACERRTIYI